jgi:hypothetical protein
MARKRFITSEISTDRKIAKLSEKNPVAAALWPWFITAFDDWGRMSADPVEVKLTLFPAFPYTSEDIEEIIKLYHEFGIAYHYEVDGKPYLAVNPEKWLKYQTYIRKSKLEQQKSKIPEPKDAPWVAKNDTNNDLATKNVAKQQSATINVLSPSPSPSPSPSKEIYICAPDGAQVSTAARTDASVEAEEVTAASEEQKPEKSGPRSPFKSKRQEQLFDEFWERYPKKRSKGRAERAWVKIKPDEQLFEAILDGLERAKTSVEWLKDDGQYIPYPSSWLNAKGWEDEYKTTAEVNNDAKHQRYTSGPYAFGNTKPQSNRFAGLVRDGGTGRIAGQEDSPNTGGDSQAPRNFEEGPSGDKGYQVTE